MEFTKVIIYTNEDQQLHVVHLTHEATSYEHEAAKVVPDGIAYEVIDSSELPNSRMFRNAWVAKSNAVEVDLESARVIAHEQRRISRDEEMKPHDLGVTIPGKEESAEVERVRLREKYAKLQTEIDSSDNVDALELLITDI